ncbi:MAG: hypothetical protein ACRDZ6_10045 [Acidimicrobiales bacterium]
MSGAVHLYHHREAESDCGLPRVGRARRALQHWVELSSAETISVIYLRVTRSIMALTDMVEQQVTCSESKIQIGLRVYVAHSGNGRRLEVSARRGPRGCRP